MSQITVYLHFDGKCEEAFSFYKDVFNAETLGLLTYRDIPVQDGMPAIPEDDLSKVENICIRISKDTILMGSDSLGVFGEKIIAGNNFSIYFEAESQDQADRYFNGLSNGGQVVVPLGPAHWGGYFGKCTDKFGISWLINFSVSQS